MSPPVFYIQKRQPEIPLERLAGGRFKIHERAASPSQAPPPNGESGGEERASEFYFNARRL